MFFTITVFLAKLAACILIADFLSGLLHWLEDSYGSEDWPISGRLITQPNILHHRDPRHFTRHSWFYSGWLLMAAGAAGLATAYAVGWLNWMTWTVALLGANANEIHKWAHRTPAENGRWIAGLQRMGVIQSPAHHARHHGKGKNSHYCVLTNLVNPILERLNLWRRLERLVEHTIGVQPRLDSSLAAGRRNSIPVCRHCDRRQSPTASPAVPDSGHSEFPCQRVDGEPSGVGPP